jgi:tetratricopeptide (TPR) repeat protein
MDAVLLAALYRHHGHRRLPDHGTERISMKARLLSVALLVMLIAGYALLFPLIERTRSPLMKVQARGMILPPLVTKMLSLEFKSITADYLFARASQYFGGKITKREAATSIDMQWFYNNILVITDMDPYFEDPYYFGNALLTWEVGMYKHANALLEKGVRARTWDWQLPFYLGFNNFYFLNDSEGGAAFIKIAAQRPGAPSFLPTLAARLYQQGQKTEIAIAFLQGVIESERDERLKVNYAMRLDALKRILYLERASIAYRKETGKLPKDLTVLQRDGFISSIPADPYGGMFYIDKDGSIKTTSKMAKATMQASPEKK